MKKLSAILLCALLFLGMAQCKKNTEISITRNITLKVSDNGSKVSVNPNTGTVSFTKGDIIYAAYNGRYAGTLTHDGENFKGTITTTGDTGLKLTFYFMGNKTPNESLDNSTTSLTVSIFDQTTGFPIISCGLSNEDYSGEEDSEYTAYLLNKCALVKFDVTAGSPNSPTIITGVKDQVSVSFESGAAGTFSYSKSYGKVKIAGGSGERWAILLPQEATGSGTAYSGNYIGTHGPIPTVAENGYIGNGVSVKASDVNAGALPGVFTVGAGKTVLFSKGNLQAKFTSAGSTCTWQFAEHQWDRIGNASANTKIDGSGSVSAAGSVDLFGWNGSSSTRDNYGIYNNTEVSNYGDVEGEALKHDWGHNAISNGGNTADTWRTLTKDEWNYVFNTRSTASRARYAKATVNNVNGMILLPDDWSTDYYALESENSPSADFTSNEISESDWTSKLEAHGAVFLPVAGFRLGTTVDGINTNEGHYWSSTSVYDVAPYVHSVYFHQYNFFTDGTPSYTSRPSGCSVRLVEEL